MTENDRDYRIELGERHIERLEKYIDRLRESRDAQAVLYESLNRDYVAIADENKRLQEQVQQLENAAEGYRSNWYKCVNNKKKQ